jgi:hypothetical protein
MSINYTLTEETLQTGLRSGSDEIDALVYANGGMANWNWLRSTESVVYYTFLLPSDDTALEGGDARSAATAFSASQMSNTKNALAYVDSITGLHHIETSDVEVANLLFANTDLIDDSTVGVTIALTEWVINGRTGEIGDLTLRQYLYLDTDNGLQDLSPGGYGYETLLHELGHALGFTHPHEDITLPSSKDNTSQTLMSYEEAGGPYSTFRPIDLAALEWLYGGDGIGGNMYGTGYSEEGDTGNEADESINDQDNQDDYDLFDDDNDESDDIDYESEIDDDLDDSDIFDEDYENGEDHDDFSWKITVYDPLIVSDSSVRTTVVGNVTKHEGSTTNNIIVGSDGVDELFGYAGSDRFLSSKGDDVFDGGEGIDAVTFNGNRSDFVLRKSGDNWVIEDTRATDANEGTDTLVGVERLGFGDKAIALDTEGPTSAGGIYRLYKATFNREPDTGGLGYWIGEADLETKDAVRMAEDFTWSQEFQDLYNITTTDNYGTGNNIRALIEGFYENVLGRTPDEGGLNFYTGVIESKDRTVGRVLAEISDSQENYDGTIELIANGIVFDPWVG